MAAKQEVQVILTGNAADLYKTLGQASKATQTMGKEMEAAVGGVKNLLLGFAAPLAALAAVLGGAELFKGAVEETKTWTVEAQKLARVLNITTEQASVLNLAIGDIYGTQEEYLTAVAKLTKTLNTNEDAIHRLGVATRDQNGNLRDTPSIMAEVNAALANMKGGTDSNVASAQIYGKSWLEVQRYLKLTPEVMQAAQEKAEKLNLIVGQDAVEATNAYRASMNDLEDTVKGLRIRLGSELMPLMTEFNDLAAEQGPGAVSKLGASIGALKVVFQAFYLVAAGTFDALMVGFRQIGNAIGTFAEASQKLQAGDFAGMRAALTAGKEKAGGIFQEFLAETKENVRKLQEAYTLGFGGKNEPTGPQAPTAGGNTLGKAASAQVAEKEKKVSDDSERLRREELAAWAKYQDDLAVIYMTSLEQEERRINISYDQKIERAKQFNATKEGLDRIELEREIALEHAKTDAAAKASEERRKIMEQEAQEAREVLERTGTAQQGMLDGIQEYLARQGSVFQQWAAATQQLLQGLENAFSRSIQGILTGQLRGAQILKSIWQGVSGAIIQVLGQMVAKWIVATIAAKIFGEASSDAAKEQAVAQQASAASTLWATYAGIPFAGPAIAAGFIALMNASLIANAASAKGIVGAAEGGWFDQPTLTMIGEGKRPELVVPDVAFKDFATNLARNILTQERQAQAYGRQSYSYAAAAPAGGGPMPSFDLRGAMFLGSEAETRRMFGELAFTALQERDRRNG